MNEEALFKKWEKDGFIENLKGEINPNIQKLYESESKHNIKNDNMTEKEKKEFGKQIKMKTIPFINIIGDKFNYSGREIEEAME